MLCMQTCASSPREAIARQTLRNTRQVVCFWVQMRLHVLNACDAAGDQGAARGCRCGLAQAQAAEGAQRARLCGDKPERKKRIVAELE